ncbi:hypothetical protein RFI_33518, partial [Reticulomyxa filosa]
RKQLHMRLFGEQTKTHQDWNTSQCDVTINNKQLIIDRKNIKTSSTKQKGYNVVKPLDISEHADTCMDIELASNAAFQGAVIVEIVRVTTVHEMARRVEARSTVCEVQNGRPLFGKKCAICDQTKDLLRCSRCKGVWYCGTTHQAQDWPFHQTICQSAENRPRLPEMKKEVATVEDDVCVGQTKVSLRCPLSIIRIQTPVRGCHCIHPQCLDLESYLAFSHRTGNWQCPVCTQPLKFEELCVDYKMMQILKNTTDDIDTVRLNPDGTYQIVTLQEQIAEDEKCKDIRKKKRTFSQIMASDSNVTS